MKKMILSVSVFLMTAALIAPGFAQEAQPAPAQVSPAAPVEAAVTPAVPAKKKAAKKKAAKKAAPKAAAPAAVQEPAPAAVAEVPQVVPQAEAAPVASAVVSEPVKPEPARRSVCPGCFQPLMAGYNEILGDLKPWIEEMEVKAAAMDQMLSAIQKRINEKDDAIEQAKLGTDKKEVKAALKVLNKERKAFLNEYSDASDAKSAFYRRFAQEAEKRVEGYNKIVELRLKATLSSSAQ
jgi:hypothetical protein